MTTINGPFPINVVTTGIPVFSTSSIIRSLAPLMLTPPPNKNSGRLALLIIEHAFYLSYVNCCIRVYSHEY